MKNIAQNAATQEKLHRLYQESRPAHLKTYQEATGQTAPGMLEYGMISAEDYDTDNGILIVLKEPNNWSQEDFDESSVFYTDFVCGLIEDKDNRGIRKGVSMPMWYNLGRWVTAIREPERPSEEIAELYQDALEALWSAAVTNVNKINGGRRAEASYYEIAQSKTALDTLWEEIRILAPKYILFCGTAWLLGDDRLDQLRAQGRTVIDMWHPGAHKKKSMMIDAVKNQLPQNR